MPRPSSRVAWGEGRPESARGGAGNVVLDASRATDWIRKAEQLHQQRDVVEKELERWFSDTSSELRQEAILLRQQTHQLDVKREREAAKMTGRLGDLARQVAKVRLQVQVSGEGPGALQQLRQLMEAAEESIAAFKAAQRGAFDELVEEEALLAADVALSERKFEQWVMHGVSERAQSAPRAASRGRGRVARAVTDAVPEAARRPAEMEQLDSEIASRGGRTGGWDDADHDVFLRVLRQSSVPHSDAAAMLPARHARVQGALDKVTQALPLVREQVALHYDWLCWFVEAQARRRRWLQQWREQRAAARQQDAAAAAAAAAAAPAVGTPRTDGHALEQGSGSLSQRSTASQQARQQAERERQRQQVLEWRASKAAAAAAEAEAAAERERGAAAAAEALRARRRARVQARLTEFREQRADADARSAQAEAALRRAAQARALAPEEVAARRAQELQRAKSLHALLEERQRRAAAAADLPQPPARVQPRVARDPARARGVTAAAAARAHTPSQLDSRERARREAGAHDAVVPSAAGAANARGRGYTCVVQARAVPAWRKGL